VFFLYRGGHINFLRAGNFFAKISSTDLQPRRTRAKSVVLCDRLFERKDAHGFRPRARSPK
jgi:hypothetical protein